MPSADCDLKTIIRCVVQGTRVWCLQRRAFGTWVEYHLPFAFSGENIAGRAAEDFGQVKPILQALLTCVLHLHKAGVIHGDIKPRNMMRTGGISSFLYRYRLLDFMHF